MLLAARLGNEGTSKGRSQRFMVNEKSERTALKEVPVMEKRRVEECGVEWSGVPDRKWSNAAGEE